MTLKIQHRGKVININLELIRTIASVLTVLSIFIAYLSYRSSQKKSLSDQQTQHDKEIFEQALQSLKWAFETITNDMKDGVPDPCRLKWLTCARHLSRYYKLKDFLLTDTYKLICEENEEYWRQKFHVLLNQKALRDKRYYMNMSRSEWPENIEIKSAMIINVFSNWPESKADPLDDIEELNLIKDGKAFYGDCGRGIESYYCVFEKIKDKMEKESGVDKPIKDG